MPQTADPGRLAALSKGEVPSKTLQEILQIDFSGMMCALAPDMALPFASGEGVSRKMALCGEALLAYGGPSCLTGLDRHPERHGSRFGGLRLGAALCPSDDPRPF